MVMQLACDNDWRYPPVISRLLPVHLLYSLVTILSSFHFPLLSSLCSAFVASSPTLSVCVILALMFRTPPLPPTLPSVASPTLHLSCSLTPPVTLEQLTQNCSAHYQVLTSCPT